MINALIQNTNISGNYVPTERRRCIEMQSSAGDPSKVLRSSSSHCHWKGLFSTCFLLSPSQSATGPSWSRWEGGSASWQCGYSRSNAVELKAWVSGFFCSLLSLVLHLNRGCFDWLFQKSYQALYNNCVRGYHLEMMVYEQAKGMSS